MGNGEIELIYLVTCRGRESSRSMSANERKRSSRKLPKVVAICHFYKSLINTVDISILRVVNVFPTRGTVEITNPLKPDSKREFTFDTVYDWK
jgi:hypothetical protein